MAGLQQFPRLFAPLELNGGRVRLANRVLMGSMHTGLEELVGPSGGLDDMARYFAERAPQVGLMVTGGVAPNNAGRVKYLAAKLNSKSEVAQHKVVSQAVHAAGGKIAMQILHSGRYGYHHWSVAPSPLKSPISWFTPHALSSREVEGTIEDFVRCAALAQEAGYDGVEVMGSEGYLINQFIAAESNKRSDEWGGAYANRIMLAGEIVRRTRAATGPDFVIIYRLSMLDLVAGGSTLDEVEQLARLVADSGASLINTGIGWHQARVPTISTQVPRGGYGWVTKRLMGKGLGVPLCATNRVNMPSTAEELLAGGFSDMVSMARPFLADPELMVKAREGRVGEINTCIACNIACLDHVFVNKRASCLVNARAGYEKDLPLVPATPEQAASVRIAVVGAGPAGLAAAVTAAQRGFRVTLFEKSGEIGGQFNLAKRVPGKEEFHETVRYFSAMLAKLAVDVRFNCEATREALAPFTHVVFATGVTPRPARSLKIRGWDHAKVVGYTDVLSGKVQVGRRVAIVGAGGIGFDCAEFLSSPHGASLSERGPEPGMADDEQVRRYCAEWGVDPTAESRGGLVPNAPVPKSPREIFLLQRKQGKLGAGLGKTTGWIKRTQVKNRGVNMLSAVEYEAVDDQGLHIKVKGKPMLLPVDHVVLCHGQEPARALFDDAAKANDTSKKYFVIGGAEKASEIDARRAIDQGTRLMVRIETANTGDVFQEPVPFSAKLYEFATSMLAKT